MAAAHRQRRATFTTPPKPASMRGMQEALAALYGEQAPMPADEQAQRYRALEQAPYRKRQHDLALALPEPDSR